MESSRSGEPAAQSGDSDSPPAPPTPILKADPAIVVSVVASGGGRRPRPGEVELTEATRPTPREKGTGVRRAERPKK